MFRDDIRSGTLNSNIKDPSMHDTVERVLRANLPLVDTLDAEFSKPS
jgi:hypothetical protein